MVLVLLMEVPRRKTIMLVSDRLKRSDAGTCLPTRFAHTVDCYFTSLDYLIKAVKFESTPSDDRTRKAIRARLQAMADSLAPLVEPILESSYTESYEEKVGLSRDFEDYAAPCTCGRQIAVLPMRDAETQAHSLQSELFKLYSHPPDIR